LWEIIFNAVEVKNHIIGKEYLGLAKFAETQELSEVIDRSIKVTEETVQKDALIARPYGYYYVKTDDLNECGISLYELSRCFGIMLITRDLSAFGAIHIRPFVEVDAKIVKGLLIKDIKAFEEKHSAHYVISGGGRIDTERNKELHDISMKYFIDPLPGLLPEARVLHFGNDNETNMTNMLFQKDSVTIIQDTNCAWWPPALVKIEYTQLEEFLDISREGAALG